MNRTAFAILMACVYIAGCAAPKEWRGGGGEAQFYQDRYRCEQEAAASFVPMPVQQMTSPGVNVQPAPAQTNCLVIGNQVTCSQSQVGAGATIYNQPPRYVTIDANANNRSSAITSCLYGKGYYLQ